MQCWGIPGPCGAAFGGWSHRTGTGRTALEIYSHRVEGADTAARNWPSPGHLVCGQNAKANISNCAKFTTAFTIWVSTSWQVLEPFLCITDLIFQRLCFKSLVIYTSSPTCKHDLHFIVQKAVFSVVTTLGNSNMFCEYDGRSWLKPPHSLKFWIHVHDHFQTPSCLLPPFRVGFQCVFMGAVECECCNIILIELKILYINRREIWTRLFL